MAGREPRKRVEALTVVAGGVLIRSGSPSPSPSASPAHSRTHLLHSYSAAGTPFSLTNPDWVTVFATVFLAVGAIVTAIWAIKAFNKQKKELNLLQKQAQDQQEEQKRSQARNISVWCINTIVSDGSLIIIVACRNASDLPVSTSR